MFTTGLRRSAVVCVAGIAGVLALTGCASDGAARSTEDGSADRLEIVTAFYPLQFAAESVAGKHAGVANLTKPGAEPHDLELGPKDIATVSDASLVIYLEGFQPAVDDAVEQEATDSSLEVSKPARLTKPALAEEEAEEHAEEARHEEHELTKDPHFWLDPTRLADVGTAIASKLSAIDPDNAQTYKDNAAELADDLDSLDAEIKQGLANCENRSIVTSHQAFAYLAERYGFTQRGIAGLSPEQEPSPAELARVARFVRQHKVETIYYETLVSPRIAKTVAQETNAQTAVLDPIEGISGDSAAQDYFGVMRADLEALQKGQSCS
jgi:zinc transport system substrate-binding protein